MFLPRAAEAASTEDGMATPITKEGYEKKKAELDQFERVDKPRISQAIAEARAEGDLRENAEYHAQRESLGLLEERIRRLRGELADCIIVDKDSLPKDRVVFGRQVKLLDVGEDFEETFELVGPGEEDYTGDVIKILSTSPLATQLINKKVGDEVFVDTPSGKVHYRILAIE
jgi:transcription elongation factor GreA